jgi:hypothetical protein
MPDNQGGGGTPAPVPPAMDVAAISKAVADSLKAEISQEITGAVKRNVASALEGVDFAALKELAGKNKGESPAPPQPGTVKAVELELANLKGILKAEQEARAKAEARANRKGVEAAVAAVASDDAVELVTSYFAGLVKPTETGELTVDGSNGPVPFEAALTAYLKDKPGLLKSAARPGSGAAAGTGGYGPEPKTKGELLYVFGKDAKGRPTRTPRSGARDAYVAAHGQAAYDALPM